ncbi:hypothetical protein QWY93_01840 [Echinicola jeungdonensis]|uniref:Lipoprotein n=1 Tax=Echinicola jeungdonensis TaxID=709343 RepID=A0ABV5J601_9BACT|nr:hypothetical protein [Echinicola jeungdonensis]MDN3668076.1 hypothetical protein [Echinicola jeungdonensis]
MKTLKFLFLIGGITCMLTACEMFLEEAPRNGNQESDLVLQARSLTKQLMVPYKAKMETSQADDALSEICSFISPTDFWGQEHQVGGGNATHIGNFTIDLKFCFHVVINEEGLPDIEGGFGEFTGGDGIIEANNGDLLYTSADGGVLVPIQHDKYNFEFVTIFHVTGGTGRFENASGEITNYGFVKADGSGTDHIQEGTIILNK